MAAEACRTQVESAAITAFVELVAKLNDTAFRPLFRRLFDWAFQGIVLFYSFGGAMSVLLIMEFGLSPRCNCDEEDRVLQCLHGSLGSLQGNVLPRSISSRVGLTAIITVTHDAISFFPPGPIHRAPTTPRRPSPSLRTRTALSRTSSLQEHER